MAKVSQEAYEAEERLYSESEWERSHDKKFSETGTADVISIVCIEQ